MSHSPAYREAHPLPYVLLHWTHLLSMLVLGATGFFIHYPFAPLRMDVMRAGHFVSMYVLLIALVARVWYAFAGTSAVTKGSRVRERDFRNFTPQPGDAARLVQTARYYLFLGDAHPDDAKYNPLQKAAYVVIGVLLLAQAYTGFALYGPAQTGPLGMLFSVGTALVGGLMAMRMLHYALMWAFILITVVHVYLSVTQDLPGLPLMFFWRESAPAPVEAAEGQRRAG